jgi:hypothetical protein
MVAMVAMVKWIGQRGLFGLDGWVLFRPEALSLKGLGTLTTYIRFVRFSQGLAQAL